MSRPSLDPQFDAFAAEYDSALQRGLAISGEDRTYFARGRIRHTAGRLSALGIEVKRVMDFGGGTGLAVPILRECFPRLEHLLGVDVSARSLEVARRMHGGLAGFALMDDYRPDESFDLVYCNGVFHHIPPEQRLACLAYVRQSLRPGGIFALWENNPWNPGTRLVMRRIPFDRDALPLSPRQARKLVREAGFKLLRTDFLFLFPRMLRWLRPIEQLVVRLPAGAQYGVMAAR
jgi:SAM-dependent methyltransferase